MIKLKRCSLSIRRNLSLQISLPPGGRGTTEVVEGARATSFYRKLNHYESYFHSPLRIHLNPRASIFCSSTKAGFDGE